MVLWVVGKVEPDNYEEWEFQGVFDSEEKAIAECKDRFYFIGPVILNKILFGRSIKWEGAYYPK